MNTPPENLGKVLAGRLQDRSATIGVIGLGYVGLPLAIAAARSGFTVLGFDIDPGKVTQLNAGLSYIDAVSSEALSAERAIGRFEANSDSAHLALCDVIVICVPTPLTKQREPDLSYIEDTARTIASHLRAGQMVVLESTTWPGTTREVIGPILGETGLVLGQDVFVAFSPERENPGSTTHSTVSIPKVVAGDGAVAHELVKLFYSAFIQDIVPVSSTDTAEAVKITENIFRAVNVALVNELKQVYDAMGIDVWEVINAASTKPFGFMPFYPGPGLGGHCIPIDPFYLTWRAREFGITTRFIELAGEVNRAMPSYVIQKLEHALDAHAGKSLSRARVLILGVAYKKNVSDIRESPSLRIMELLSERGTDLSYHDPHVAVVPPTRAYMAFAGQSSVALTPETLAAYDAVLIATDHANVDYAAVRQHAKLIVDTRNAVPPEGGDTAIIVRA